MNKLIDIFILTWAILMAIMLLGITANVINISDAGYESLQEDVRYKKEQRIRYHAETHIFWCEDQGRDFMILNNKVTCID